MIISFDVIESIAVDNSCITMMMVC